MMIIESIKIKNFLSHEDTEIDFEQGINIITGKNGAGKTSVLDAIKFALFAESRNNVEIMGLWSSGYDASLTRKKSPVQIRPGPFYRL